jgi:hypothetical protein
VSLAKLYCKSEARLSVVTSTWAHVCKQALIEVHELVYSCYEGTGEHAPSTSLASHMRNKVD